MTIPDFLDTLVEVHEDRITAPDLVAIIKTVAPCRTYLAGPENTQRVQILYLPLVGRAGIYAGADSDWTDCDSARDALERYFGVDGKEMRQ